MKIGTDITPVSFSLTRDSAVEGELRHIGVGSPKRLFGRLVGAIKEVWVHIIPLQGGGRERSGERRGKGERGRTCNRLARNDDFFSRRRS